MDIDFDALWKIVAAPFLGHTTSLHGPGHWRRVERNGILLASRTGANVEIVRLFALFHDSRRMNDGWDPGHGTRGAEFADIHLGKSFQLPDEDITLFRYACIWHTEGVGHDDPTIATCWDADRLDLGRVGIVPDPKRMCTEFGREIATAGRVEMFLDQLKLQ
ncbi:MAG: hypothetical protein ACJ8LM_15770 [Candidatus Udaeobacter sp.]